jgi:hypothetical protein
MFHPSHLPTCNQPNIMWRVHITKPQWNFFVSICCLPHSKILSAACWYITNFITTYTTEWYWTFECNLKNSKSSPYLICSAGLNSPRLLQLQVTTQTTCRSNHAQVRHSNQWWQSCLVVSSKLLAHFKAAVRYQAL